jgi:tetratricopeptide (TPR) repeat protein
MTSASLLKEQALAHFRAERLNEAAAGFEQAAQAFAAEGDPGAAAEMRNNVAVVRLAQKDWPGALAALEGTPAVFRALGDKLREAQAWSNRAAALDGAGDLDQAAGLYQQAIDQFGALGERENRAACLKALSALQIKQGKQFQALASMQAGLNTAPKLNVREKTLKGLLDRALKMIGGGQ